MMTAINQFMLAVSNSLAASIVAKVTVTTALGLIAVWLARRSRAALRHALLAAAFGVLLLLPLAAIVAPPIRIAITGAAPQFAPLPGNLPRVAAQPTLANTPSPSPEVTPATLLFAAWIAGAAAFLLPVILGLWQVRSLRRSALPWARGNSLAAALAREAGLRRRVDVLLHEAVPGPMTCGALHPAIVLPRDAESWQNEDVTRAIVHELEHVRRGDWASQCLARTICSAYWFHPLVWIAWRRFVLEAEHACDDAVLRSSEATAYADQLVGLAQRLSTAAKGPLLAMANRADLSKRVGAVLRRDQRRGRAGRLPVALACSAAVLLVLAVSPLTMVAAPQEAAVHSTAVFRTNGSLVMVDVTISDAGGKDIEGLGARDFALTEDGAPQTISVFEYRKAQDSSLRSYYLLGYYTSNPRADGTFRQIQVTNKADPTAKLDYRAGYYARRSAATFAFGDRTADPNIKPPALLFKKEPEYSDEARKAKYQGTVILQAEIDASGVVTNVSVTHSLGLGLDQKAIDAVRQWRFRPATKDGKPLAVLTQVEVDFRLL